MKKKNLILTLVVGALVGTMLTGCGNKEVTKVDDSKAVISEVTEEPTEETTEAVETTEEPTETVEPTEEPTEEEVVVNDFFSRTGNEPMGAGTYELMLSHIDEDERIPMLVDITMTQATADKEGYAITTWKLAIDTAVVDSYEYCMTAFDRYTGINFESNPTTFETNEEAVNTANVCVIDVDGKQYDCSIEVSQDMEGTVAFLTMAITHPEEYDGTVFQFGSYTEKQKEIYYTVNFEEAYIVDEVPELFAEQYFFTLSGE